MNHVLSPAPDLTGLRADFPILSREVHGKPLVYLDNGATSQKPQAVIDAIREFYRSENSNIHRGVHYLSVTATQSYDRARETIARFLGVSDSAQLIFVRGTTEAINLVAHCWGGPNLREGDEILLTQMEHHANIVPWQTLAHRIGATLQVVPLLPDGSLDLDAFRTLISPRTRLAAITHISNVLGTVNPVAEICRLCREHGVVTMIDGAQAAPHMQVDLKAIGCDFYAFSGHKVFGPDGIGVLFGRRDLLEAMPPYQTGGDMVESVSFERSTFKPIPEKFEAGTPNISAAIGLEAAFNYRATLPWDELQRHEHALLEAATESLLEIPGVHIQGTAAGKMPVISFTLDGVHPHDIGTILDSDGVAIRAGNHCAQPLLAYLGVPSTARASFAFYNTLDEVEILVKAVDKCRRFFA